MVSVSPPAGASIPLSQAVGSTNTTVINNQTVPVPDQDDSEEDIFMVSFGIML